MSDITYEKVDWDGETYREIPSRRPVTMNKLLNVRVDGEEIATKLSFTTVYFDAENRDCSKEEAVGKVLKGCIRVGGERIDLDDDRVEIASDCLIR